LKDCKEFMVVTINNKDHQIKLARTIDDPYFCGKDVCVVLGYKDFKDALQRYVDTDEKKSLKELNNELGDDLNSMLGKYHKILSYHDGKAIYINTNGLKSLLQKNRVAHPDRIKVIIEHPFIKQIGLEMNLIQAFKEQECIGAIVKTLSHLKTYIQFKVNRYRLDLYIPDYNLAIECDEFNHSNRDSEYEKQREYIIKNELNCEFIRFNPDVKNFSTYDVIGEILKHVERSKNEELKASNQKINKLKVEVENLTEQLEIFLFSHDKKYCTNNESRQKETRDLSSDSDFEERLLKCLH
jgi:very-short-patch-repair endonuclease